MRNAWSALQNVDPHDRLVHSWIMIRYPTMLNKHGDPCRCNVLKPLWKRMIRRHMLRCYYVATGYAFWFSTILFLINLLRAAFSESSSRMHDMLVCSIGFALCAIICRASLFAADKLKTEVDAYEKDILRLPELYKKAVRLREMIQASPNCPIPILCRIVSEYYLILLHYQKNCQHLKDKGAVPMLLKSWSLPKDMLEFAGLIGIFRLRPCITLRRSNHDKPHNKPPSNPTDPDDGTREADWWKNTE